MFGQVFARMRRRARQLRAAVTIDAPCLTKTCSCAAVSGACELRILPLMSSLAKKATQLPTPHHVAMAPQRLDVERRGTDAVQLTSDLNPACFG